MTWTPPFSEAEYRRRAAAVRAALAERELDAAVCYGARGAPGLVEYLAAFSPRWESYLILPRDPALPSTLLVQLFNHVPNARLRSTVPDTRWGGPDSAAAVAAQLRELGLGAGRVGLAGPVPHQRHAALLRELPTARWEDVSGPLGRLRWVKSGEEIACMRRAAELTDAAVAALARELRPGLREWELPARMQGAGA
ncbi:MAG TPA: hypothetical protein PKD53_27690, partial [Chloroflexaceae bacterium]|nr:hypothetical protein [Chloroflexaceae bacterium]